MPFELLKRPPKPEAPITLAFCIWLHKHFDVLVACHTDTQTGPSESLSALGTEG